MFALHSRRLRRRLSAPTSGSARRRTRDRRAAERTRQEGERLARERRERRVREKIENQRLLREELASYEPWGRAGGGAPNLRGVRFSDLRSKGIYPEDELRGVASHEAGRHRPLRRRMPLSEDPQLCYTDALHQTIDNVIRYKQTPQQQQIYKQILDDMVHKRQKAIKGEIKRELEYDRKMQTMDGPWGKPGPGGIAWRNPRNIGLDFAKSMGWTDNDIFDTLKRECGRYNRSSLTLPKVKTYDASSRTLLDRENVKSDHEGKLPQITADSNAINEKRGNLKEDGTDEVANTSMNTSNVKTQRSPKKSKFIKRLSNGERVRRLVLEHEADNVGFNNVVCNNVNEKKLTPEETILRLTGGVELVPLLARRRRVGARTLPSSDVTRPPYQACQWRELLDMDYLRQLKHQMRVKCDQQEESRRESAESSRRHHATWASLWGRPGHGAPQRGRYARHDIARLLYVPPLTNTHL